MPRSRSRQRHSATARDHDLMRDQNVGCASSSRPIKAAELEMRCRRAVMAEIVSSVRATSPRHLSAEVRGQRTFGSKRRAAALPFAPRDLHPIFPSCAAPAEGLRCVGQSSSLKPGGSSVPGAEACRIIAKWPAVRRADHTSAAAAFKANGTPSSAPRLRREIGVPLVMSWGSPLDRPAERRLVDAQDRRAVARSELQPPPGAEVGVEETGARNSTFFLFFFRGGVPEQSL